MRLVNSDRLLGALDATFEGCDYTIVANIVKNTPTVMQWVSVENMLPPPETLVLAYHRASYFHEGVNETMKVSIGSYSNKWHSGFTGNGLLGVTHWMPLPPPPGKQNTFTSE